MARTTLLPFFTLTIIIALAISSSQAQREKISPEVIRSVVTYGHAPEVMVDLVTPADSFLSDLKSMKFPNRQARVREAFARLSTGVESSQAGVIEVLERERASNPSVTYRTFRTANKIYIKRAGKDLLDEIAAQSEVERIREPVVMSIPEPLDFEENSPASYSPMANEWGIEMINAPQAWADGYTGKGITVGIIDTGCRGTHEAIRGNMKPTYGWYDPSGECTEPCDDFGHGTHVTGTILGAKGIGVAPSAEFISCRGCIGGGCPEYALSSCYDKMLCPNPDEGCSAAPDVISNSWGGGRGDQTFYQQIKSCRDAGIISVFANGNSGPGCESATSPGDSDYAMAVGAVDRDTSVCDFSSRGPSVLGTVKPDVSAPGKSVRSAWASGDNSYVSISGTSMACPHVSGLVALLLQKHPNVRGNPDALSSLITSRYVRTDVSSDYKCGEDDGTLPNNCFGNGIVRYSSY